MKFSILLLYCALCIVHCAFSQVPTIQWQKCIGGSKADFILSIKQTTDGGYIAAGSTASNDGDVSGNHDTTGNTADAWVVKLDSGGAIKWQRCYGGSANEEFNSIIQTTDGGYIAAGGTASNNGDVSGYHGGGDIWVVKIDSGGNIRWEKCYGGSGDDYANIIQQTTDSGYIIVGQTNTHDDGDVSGFHPGGTTDITDSWVVKIDSVGHLQWQKCLGGTGPDWGADVHQTADGEYIVTNYSTSPNGNVTCSPSGHGSYWVVKLNTSGAIQWQKCYGGTYRQTPQWGRQTMDRGYILGGYTTSDDGDVSGLHGPPDSFADIWIVKTDSIGNLSHQKCLGGTDEDEGAVVIQPNDSGYIVLGTTASTDGDITYNHGLQDVWLVKLDTALNIKWQKCFGGSNEEAAGNIEQTKDGGFIFAAATLSNDGDVSGNHGGYGDGWVVKLSREDVGVNEQKQNMEDFTAFLTATNNLMLNFFSPSLQKIKMSVLDITGGVIMQQEFYATAGLNKHEATVGLLAKGVYLVRLITEDRSLNTKFVKE